jgi:NADH dehydrogenase [ubiquinone] 1 alpha subcomplex assembly factor 1
VPGGGESAAEQSHLAFHGNLSLTVPPAYQGRIRTGYAAFRSRSRPSLFGEETWDLSLYSHLKVEVGYRGWEGWRNRWVVNIQTDGPVR